MTNYYEMSSQMTRRAQLHDHINKTIAAAKQALLDNVDGEGVSKAVVILDAAEAKYQKLHAAAHPTA